MKSAAAVALLLLTVSAKFISGSAGGGCSSELLAISPCLPYVAMAPNNLSSVADPLCCDPFRTASDGVAHCLCRLLREPALLGFPLNLTRLLSLFSFCPASSSFLDADTLQSICRRIHSGPPSEFPAGESGPPPEFPAGESGPPTEVPAEIPVPSSGSPITSSLPLANSSASVPPRSVCSRILPELLKLLSYEFGFVFSTFY